MASLMLFVIAFVDDALSEKDGFETGISTVLEVEAVNTFELLLTELWMLL